MTIEFSGDSLHPRFTLFIARINQWARQTFYASDADGNPQLVLSPNVYNIVEGAVYDVVKMAAEVFRQDDETDIERRSH